jgi:hypothetical protein
MTQDDDDEELTLLITRDDLAILRNGQKLHFEFDLGDFEGTFACKEFLADELALATVDTALGHNERCPICLEAEADQLFVRTHCNHVLCLTCYEQLLISKMSTCLHVHTTLSGRRLEQSIQLVVGVPDVACPLCRASVMHYCY